MNPRLIRLIIVLMFLAMTGLIGIQIYWIRGAVEQREQLFEQAVYEAMTNAVYDYEKMRIEREMNKLFNWKQVEKQMQQHLDSLKKKKKKGIKYNQDIAINIQRPGKGQGKIWFNSGGPTSDHHSIIDPFGVDVHENFEYFLPEISGDTATFLENVDEAYQLLSANGAFFGEFFKEMLSGYISMTPSDPDTLALDSIIGLKLAEQGINTGYNFGIYDIFLDKLTYTSSNRVKKLTHSEYRIPLSINPFNNQHYLVLFFPHKTQFILRNLLFLLAASTFLILIIIFSFSYTINTIYRQKKLSEIKNDLINNITHELKTPISTISLACQAMNDPDLMNSSLKDKYVNMISEENNRLALLVENVLQSAVFEKEGFRLKIKQVDLHARIDKAIASLSMQAQTRGVKIIKRLDAKDHEIEADEVMITNLIFNLIDNGIKYSQPNQPFIEISTRNQDQHIILEIRDNGIGISKDDQKRIFEKLYRVPTGNVHNVKGFGLGLSYVKSIVERHHGTIEVKSQLGEGSTFIVKLPLKQQSNNSLHLK